MQELVRVGWLDVKIEHQHEAIAAATQYTVSQRWKEYRLDEQERQDFYSRKSAKEKQLRRDYMKKSKILSSKQIPGPIIGGMHD